MGSKNTKVKILTSTFMIQQTTKDAKLYMPVTKTTIENDWTKPQTQPSLQAAGSTSPFLSPLQFRFLLPPDQGFLMGTENDSQPIALRLNGLRWATIGGQ